MFSLRRKNPHAAGSRAVDIPLLIDLYSVGHAIFFTRRHIEKYFAVSDGSIRLHFISPEAFGEGIVHVEIFFVRRESDAVGSFQVFDDQLKFPAREAVHAREWQLLLGVLIELAQAERRIGKIK